MALATLNADISNQFNWTNSFPSDAYLDSISNLKVYGSYIIEDYSAWSYCPSSRIINEKVIPVWTSDSPKSIVYESLVDVAQSTLKNVMFRQSESFFESNSLNGYDSKYSLYIYFNTLTVSIGQFQHAIDGLKACQSNRINDLTLIVYFLMIAGFSALGLNFIIVSWYLIRVDKLINLCWISLLKNIKYNYTALKDIVKYRLAKYQKIHNEKDHKVLHTSKGAKLKFNFYWRYMIRFIVLFILSAALYLVAVFVFYENIKNYLIYRVNFITVFLDTKVKLIQLTYFALEIEASQLSYGTERVYNYSITPDVVLCFNQTNQDLIKLTEEIRSPSMTTRMPSSVWNIVYNSLDQYEGFLKYGTFDAIKYYRAESMCLANPDCRQNGFDKSLYINDLMDLMAALNNITNAAGLESKNKIQVELDSLIYFITFTLVFFVIFYLSYLLPYFTEQQEMLKKFDFIIKAIPETRVADLK